MAWPRASSALSIAFLVASIDTSAAIQAASPDSSAAGRDSSAARVDITVVSKPMGVAQSPAILAACREIDERDLLRIEADIGTFEGFASGADSTGVFGFRSSNAIDADAFFGQLQWEQIRTVEIRENNAKKSAVRGALTLGAIGLLAGMLSVRLDRSTYPSSNPNVSRVIVPTALGVAIGGGIGWAVGSSKRVWRHVYP